MPSSVGRDIPTEIWESISHFIPSRDLRGLYSVNRIFLQLALNERYRRVYFVLMNPKTLEFLEHMRSDPNIATRVRHLHIHPDWFKPYESRATTSSPNKNNILQRIRSKVERRLVFLKPAAKVKQRQETIDTLMTSVVTFFPNVTSFVIMTQYYQQHHSPLPLFLSNSWQTFGSNLQRLLINAPLREFKPLFLASDDLVSLQDLTLRFTNIALNSEVEFVGTEMLNSVVAPFLRKLAPRLQRLIIVSLAHGDHSGFFGALGQFPELTSLSLSIGFHPRLLVNPSGLTKFLRLNAINLKHVRFHPYEPFDFGSIPGPPHSHFSQWMSSNAADSESGVLNGLQSLVISPCIDSVSSANLDTTSVYIQRSRDTLTKLVLGDGYLSFSDLETLVGAFAHRPAESGLKMLYVKVISLNPQLFDLLAKKLPGLDDLDVTFNNFHVVEDEALLPFENHPLEDSDIEAFLRQMSQRIYPDWSLYGLWIWRSYMTFQTAHKILDALERSIPSVKAVYRMEGIHQLNTIFKLN